MYYNQEIENLRKPKCAESLHIEQLNAHYNKALDDVIAVLMDQEKSAVDNSPETSQQMKTIYIQHWTESERGWGQRPDGISIHASVVDRDAFINEYTAKVNNKTSVPDDYSFASGNPKVAQIDSELLESIGLDRFLSDQWLRENIANGKVVL